MQLKICGSIKVASQPKYGGRLSSVLSIYQKEGNKEEFKLNGGIGLVTSRLLAEGPLGKGSFVVGGRGTYAHLFLQLTDNPNGIFLRPKYKNEFSN